MAVFHMAAAGAALATVLAQAFSVILCVVIIKKRGIPFSFKRENIRFNRDIVGKVLKMGFPIALQDGLVSVSFLAIISIVNSLGLIASAGVGVAEKLCGFIMLVPSAFSQSLSAFVALCFTTPSFMEIFLQEFFRVKKKLYWRQPII